MEDPTPTPTPTPTATPTPTPTLTPTPTPTPTPTVTPTPTPTVIKLSNEGTHFSLTYQYGANKKPQQSVNGVNGKKISRNVKDLRRRNSR